MRDGTGGDSMHDTVFVSAFLMSYFNVATSARRSPRVLPHGHMMCRQIKRVVA